MTIITVIFLISEACPMIIDLGTSEQMTEPVFPTLEKVKRYDWPLYSTYSNPEPVSSADKSPKNG